MFIVRRNCCYVIFLCAALFGFSPSAYSNVVIGSVAQSGRWGAVQFDHAGGPLTIDSFGHGFTGGPTGSGIDDITLTLLVDDGSPLTAFTGSAVAFNDNRSPAFSIDASTSSRDSTITLPSLLANSYLLAIGHSSQRGFQQFSGDISSGSGIALSLPDYQITFSLDVLITALDGVSTLQTAPPPSNIPEPAPLALLGLGLLGLIHRRRKKS